jgi:ribosome-associated protein
VRTFANDSDESGAEKPQRVDKGPGYGGAIHERISDVPQFFHVFEVDEVVDLIQRAHGRDVCVIDLRKKHWSIADHFVLATGRSTEHLQRIARGVLYKLKQKCKEVAPGLTPRIDGIPGSEWVAVDAGSVIVHVQLERTRRFYDIEGLHGEPDGSNMRQIPNKEVIGSTIHTLDTLKPPPGDTLKAED